MKRSIHPLDPMSRPQALVREFHRSFGLGAPDRPSLKAFPASLRIRLLEEELGELRRALKAHNLADTVDALCDLLYVTYGAGVSLGVDLAPFFEEVHRTNMAKRGARRRSDGKQLKPSNWAAPRINEILERMYADLDCSPSQPAVPRSEPRKRSRNIQKSPASDRASQRRRRART